MAQSDQNSLIDPTVLGQLHALDVAARMVVDGMNAGAHRSPHKGHSVDFADHRPYVPGDDLRHLDWKVLGRRDRLVLKRYEAETDFGCSLAVDGSASMAYSGSRALVGKYRYASVLAASVAYLVLGQQDRAGLQIFAEDLVSDRPLARQDQLPRICADLEAHSPAEGTDTGAGLSRLALPSHRRGLVIIFSDLLCDLDDFAKACDRLRHRGHDVAVVWILDPDEKDLRLASVSRFQGMEGEGEFIGEPKALRAAYVEEFEKHHHALQRTCRSRHIALVTCGTDEAPQHPLNRWLVALQRDARGISERSE